jgi:hypothetical protein
VPSVEQGPQCDVVRAAWALWTGLLYSSADGNGERDGDRGLVRGVGWGGGGGWEGVCFDFEERSRDGVALPRALSVSTAAGDDWPWVRDYLT